MVNLTFAMLNVRGLHDNIKRRNILNYLDDQSYDIVCLQETHSTPNIEKYWMSESRNKIYYNHGTSESRGCAIIFRTRPTKIHNIVRHHDG